ncbi:hypothetical protein TWF696_000515 [Orbilia brochopaga]|uniref:Protein ZIP4 homolog n=1 Tax=Orbilia brochopaga TaxID=3140254 RepID=A0AAV9VE88_9PEZI
MEDKLQAISQAKLEKQIKQFLASIDNLLADLKSTHKNNPSTWPSDRLGNLLQAIEKCTKARGHIKARDDHAALDQRGTELWNMTTKLLRSESPSDLENRKIYLKLRHLAYLTLDSAQRTSGRTTRGSLRLVKIAVKAGKTDLGTEGKGRVYTLRTHIGAMLLLLEQNDVSLAGTVLSNAAKYIDDLSKSTTPLSAEDEGNKINLECEYLVLRIELSFLQHNLHAAEFMCNNAMERFSRDDGAADKLEPRVREALGKVLYRIGKDVVEHGDLLAGLDWLAKALEVVDARPVGSDHFATELRFGIMQNFVKASLQSGSVEDLQRAKDVMDTMTKEWPERLNVHSLGLDIIVAQNLGTEAYHAALMKMISSVPLSEHSFKVIVGKCHVLLAQDLHGHGHRLACSAMDHFVTERLIAVENQGWIEKAFVTRVWMMIQGTHPDEDVIPSLYQLCEATAPKLARPLSTSATHASQILLWKMSDSLVNNGQWLETIQWCKAALHPIFSKSGELNAGKIARRIIHCAIEAGDSEAAQAAYESMPAACRETGSTQFLLFKSALRSLDLELAHRCLENVCRDSNKDISILYACALEAQSNGNKDIILKVLTQLLEQADTTTPPDGVHVPAIYRTMIRLILSDIHDNKAVADEILVRLYSVFEKALNNALQSKMSGNAATATPVETVKPAWGTDEYDWFSRNSYNLALRALQHWPIHYALRFARLCIQFIKLYPAETSSEEEQENLALRQSFCDYICASTCTALARKEGSMDEQLQFYRDAGSHINTFRELREKLLPRLTEQSQKDFGERYLGLLIHEFEACVHLADWCALQSIVDQVGKFGQMQPLRRVGDMILCVDAPTETFLLVLESVINYSIAVETHKVDKIARWIRILLQKSLQGDLDRAKRLVYQVLDICKIQKPGNEYPQDELEWIAATLWNLGIDKNCAGDYSGSKKWAEFALSVAGCVQDGGQLEALLHAKYANLRTS